MQDVPSEESARVLARRGGTQELRDTRLFGLCRRPSTTDPSRDAVQAFLKEPPACVPALALPAGYTLASTDHVFPIPFVPG